MLYDLEYDLIKRLMKHVSMLITSICFVRCFTKISKNSAGKYSDSKCSFK